MAQHASFIKYFHESGCCASSALSKINFKFSDKPLGRAKICRWYRKWCTTQIFSKGACDLKPWMSWYISWINPFYARQEISPSSWYVLRRLKELWVYLEAQMKMQMLWKFNYISRQCKNIVKNTRGIPENAEKGPQAVSADSWPLHVFMGLQINPLNLFSCCIKSTSISQF